MRSTSESSDYGTAAVCDRRFTVAVCDSQPLVVEGLKSVLCGSGRYRLLEPAPSLDLVGHQIVTTAPRIALIDKTLGTSETVDWVGRMRGRSQTALVVWGLSLSDSEAIRFLQFGVRGVLRKTASTDSLLSCFDAVCNGATWMDDNLVMTPGRTGHNSRLCLTAREQQVLELVEQGLRNKDIARELGIQPGTVKIHLKHIFEKSGVRGRYGLALSGLRDRYSAHALIA